MPIRARTMNSADAERHAMFTLVAILLVLLLLGAVPAWPYSRGWGYGPSGAIGLILLILVILILLGRI